MTSIYIESGDEITTVIERLRGSNDADVALVAPKGATLLQSVVNLKLARKAAADAGKSIVIVSTDKIGRNLCEQLGIPAANTEEEAAKALAGEITSSGSDAKVIAGVRVHNYYDEEHGDSKDDNEKIEPIIIPKQMLKEEEVVAETPIDVPAGTPEPTAPAEVVAAPLTRTAIARPEDPAVEVIEPHTKPETKSGISKTHKRVVTLSLFLAGVAALIIIAVAFLFLPFMRVDVAVKATDWSRELAFSASTDQTSTSSDSTALPAEQLSVSVEKTVPFTATGTKQVGEKATGTVTLYNYSTTSSVTVPSGTTVSSSGKTFVTTAAVVVPGYTQAPGNPPAPGTKDAPIVANEAGPDSNLTNASASNITVNGAVLSFNVVNTSGGTSKTVTVVSSDDINKAKALLTTELTAEAIQKMTDTIGSREVINKADADIVEPGTATPNVTAGQEVANGEVAGSLVLKRTIINRTTFESALTDRLRADQLAHKSYEVTQKDITVTSLSSDGKLMSLNVVAAGKEAPVIPTAEIVKELAGKSITNGKKYIEEKVENSTVTTTQRPSWWPVRRFPTLNRYILLEIKYE